jgi:hypothetical protein
MHECQPRRVTGRLQPQVADLTGMPRTEEAMHAGAVAASAQVNSALQ